MDKDTLQLIRLADVFIIAPVIIGASTQVKSKVLSKALLGIGISTLIFNGVNFVREARNSG